MKTKIIVILISLSVSAGVYAQAQRRGVPATPYPIEHVQPDGDTLIYRLHGDERRHWQTTLDGYLIKQNKHGRFCYARFDKKGVIKPTCRTAHNEEKRSKCEKKYIQKHIPKDELM